MTVWQLKVHFACCVLIDSSGVEMAVETEK